MFRTPKLGDNTLVTEKTAQMRQEGKSSCIQVCNNGSRQSEYQRSDIKLRNLAFSVLEEANLWAHWIYPFHVHFSCLGSIVFPCSPCFLHSPSSSAITMGGAITHVGSIHWITVWGALIHTWRPEITDACDICCLLIFRRYFHFTAQIANKKYSDYICTPNLWRFCLLH